MAQSKKNRSKQLCFGPKHHFVKLKWNRKTSPKLLNLSFKSLLFLVFCVLKRLKSNKCIPGGYIDLWRAMQQFEGRSATTVLRDDAQRSRVEAHAVQLNLDRRLLVGKTWQVTEHGNQRRFFRNDVCFIYFNQNLSLKPPKTNSQWLADTTHNGTDFRSRKKCQAARFSCLTLVQRFGRWPLNLWSVCFKFVSGYRFSIKLVHFESKQHNMINHSNTFTFKTSGHQTIKDTEIWIP